MYLYSICLCNGIFILILYVISLDLQKIILFYFDGILSSSIALGMIQDPSSSMLPIIAKDSPICKLA